MAPLTRSLPGSRTTALAAAIALAVAGCGGSASSASTHAAGAGGGAKSARRARATATTAVRLAYRPLYSLASALQDPAAAALGAGRFVLLGGLDAADTSADAVIVADKGSAHQVAKLPNPQHDAQAVRLGSTVYVFGGGQFVQYDHILAFDPSAATVSTAGVLPRAASDVAVAGDRDVAYIVGGYDGSKSLDTILAWAPGAAPRVIGKLPVALRYAAAAVSGRALIIAGGSTPDGQASDAIYRFDPATGRVRQLGRLPAPLTHSGAAVLGDTVYLVGGRGADVNSETATVLAVNPSTGAVRQAAKLPVPLSDAGVVAVGDAIVVAGGHARGATRAGVAELLAVR